MKALIQDLDEDVNDEVDWKLSTCLTVTLFLSYIFLASALAYFLNQSVLCLKFFILHFQLDEDDFQEEQNSVAQLIQMLHNDDPEEMLKVLMGIVV